MTNLKKIFKGKEKKPDGLEVQESTMSPRFYCSLCSKFMNYSDLIDGCKCYFCDSDLFIIPRNEFKEMLSIDMSSPFSE